MLISGSNWLVDIEKKASCSVVGGTLQTAYHTRKERGQLVPQLRMVTTRNSSSVDLNRMGMCNAKCIMHNERALEPVLVAYHHHYPDLPQPTHFSE